MGELASAAGTAIVTVLVIVGVLLGVGFGLLFRRNRAAALTSPRTGADPLEAAAQRANILLVRADDAVRDAQDELDFALAQFGTESTASLSRTLSESRRQIMEAFELQQKLDDHVPDTTTQRREWTSRIAHLCESTMARLNAELKAFEKLRELDRRVPENLAALRTTIDTAAARDSRAATVLVELESAYSAAAIASVVDNRTRAVEARRLATAALETAAAASTSPSTTAAAATLSALRDGEEQVRRSLHLYDAIDTLAGQLAAATAALDSLAESTKAAIAEAKTVRDTATDAAAAASVIDAITMAETSLGQADPRDPVAALDRLREANSRLDSALAGARNQQRRLDQAREAYTGALVAARSQVTATRDFIDTRRGGIGREARTRLAEAERLLAVAQAEADPVIALDTARSAGTYARDADALARYDVMH
ncbi:hypothetical protein [Homoserinimonas hongtaonis]|uniref:hypothetical protein n=1 Tax=Homoserinimonas hongtaonis TaxID=2079791 RepID=UPI000D38B40B|nr:hypothetical protein [Salinibacterium hongtaonis]AWB89875.1 hypothetical protein C2138_10310 [Salinibacterium hongtaonis]